ncbi:MAG: hypothetical protein EOO61_04530 [Hymenobacter sp.]|nr:MAG: hypothetical protein EOO61_04530 [Hymenobacter sp.]
MESPASPPNLRLFTWIPVSTLPTPDESKPEGYTLLLAIVGIGVNSGCYMPNENQFYQHCQRYNSLNLEPITSLDKETINNSLEWEMEAVYPEEDDKAEWGTTVTHWMLIPDAPTEID